MADQEGNIKAFTELAGSSSLPEGFAEAYYRQLEKDLHRSFSRDGLRQLQEELAECLESEIENGHLEHLLYRIDLTEDYAAECLASGAPLKELAEAIMKREAVKVLFRLQHSGNG